MMQNKYVVGLSGPTGAGKSTVAKFFASVGALVIDTDVIARKVMEKGHKCLAETVSVFGTEILNDQGELVRRKLANIVFNDKKALDKLNNVTHKYIKRECVYELMTGKGDIAIIDGAVLIGSGVDELCDIMVSVIADEDTRKRRICLRDGITESEAASRIASQNGNDFYINHSDIVIHNDDTYDINTEEKRVWKQLNEKRAELIKG